MLNVAIFAKYSSTLHTIERLLESYHTQLFNPHCYTYPIHLNPEFRANTFSFFILSLDDTDIDALALAKKIRQLAPAVPLILTTTRQRLLPDLLTLDIFACIPQPIQKTQFFSTVKRLLFSLKTTPPLFHFSEYQKKIRLPCENILYFEKKRRLVIITTLHEVFSPYLTTTEVLKQLDTSFIQIHRSYIINSRYVINSGNNKVTVTDSHEEIINLPIGRTFQQSVKQKLQRL